VLKEQESRDHLTSVNCKKSFGQPDAIYRDLLLVCVNTQLVRLGANPLRSHHFVLIFPQSAQLSCLEHRPRLQQRVVYTADVDAVIYRG